MTAVPTLFAEVLAECSCRSAPRGCQACGEIAGIPAISAFESRNFCRNSALTKARKSRVCIHVYTIRTNVMRFWSVHPARSVELFHSQQVYDTLGTKQTANKKILSCSKNVLKYPGCILHKLKAAPRLRFFQMYHWQGPLLSFVASQQQIEPKNLKCLPKALFAPLPEVYCDQKLFALLPILSPRYKEVDILAIRLRILSPKAAPKPKMRQPLKTLIQGGGQIEDTKFLQWYGCQRGHAQFF